MGQGNACCDAVSKYGEYNDPFPLQADPSQNGRMIMKTTRKIGSEDVEGRYKTTTEPKLTPEVVDRITSYGAVQVPLGLERGIESLYFMLDTKTGIVYRGEWKGFVPHGVGIMYFPKGHVFNGSVYEGLPHGYGRVFTEDNYVYEGQIKYGRLSGEGKLVGPHYTYQGVFLNDVKHGKGQEKGDNGSNYNFKGQFKYGKRVKGVLSYKGNVYEGQFEDNQYSGKGRLTNPQGVYTGNFQRGLQEGYGQFKWNDGSIYRGSYYQSAWEGEGEFYNATNKNTYFGLWEKGVLNGQGSFTNSEGTKFKVMWLNGQISAVID